MHPTIFFGIFSILIGILYSAEPSGIRQFRFMSVCNKFCSLKQQPLVHLKQCCAGHNAGNWATCTKFNQALCARNDVKWSPDGNVECISYPGFGECATRYALNNS
ncbi:unnamed protein product, partial [Mesorhabditis belari]|uniref:Uncharacterized protein n=1 Tax=Mesorhabditis belari TaxID=2138241 RepID=A0AAF3ED20_9BILA